MCQGCNEVLTDLFCGRDERVYWPQILDMTEDQRAWLGTLLFNPPQRAVCLDHCCACTCPE